MLASITYMPDKQGLMKQSLYRKSRIHILAKDMKIKLMLLVTLFLIEGKGFIRWLEHNLLSCPIKQMSGVDCPGCGLQRSIVALLKGDLVSSFRLYPATIPILCLFLLTIVHLKFDFKNGAFFIKMLYIGATIIIVINYIYKIFTNQLI